MRARRISKPVNYDKRCECVRDSAEVLNLVKRQLEAHIALKQKRNPHKTPLANFSTQRH